MSTVDIISYLLIWGLIGSVYFFIMVIVFFRTGLVYTARKSDGTLKESIPLSGKLAMSIVPISYLIYQVISNYAGLVHQSVVLNFWQLFSINYLIYLILFICDTFFIDGYVIAVWRPSFLRLPNEMGKKSMKQHILKSIPIGLFIGLMLSLLASTASYLLWMN